MQVKSVSCKWLYDVSKGAIHIHVALFSLDFAILFVGLTETFALISGPIDEDFGTDDIAERQEHLHELSVTKLLGQMINEKVAAFRS